MEPCCIYGKKDRLGLSGKESASYLPRKMVSISYHLRHRPISRVHVRYPGAMQVVLDVQEEAEEAKSHVSAIET